MAVKSSHILGMNARNHRYTSVYNSKKAKRTADSKLLTKSTLRKKKLPTPRLFRVFRNERDLDKFNFDKLPESFVVKPNRGLGGEGIIVVEKRGDEQGEWLTTDGQRVTIQDLRLHITDILEGRFSMNDLPDIAFVEERIRIAPVFEKYVYYGTPDIRVIVFNRVPVMAMLRLPTKESGGRANLFQGAVGAGIDLASGVSTYGIQHGKEIVFMPGTRRKVRGIQIPDWDEVLKLAVECQEVTGLGYLGADIVLQPSIKKPGKMLPKVLELNAQPGLKIQLCNRAGLLRRLERIEGLEVGSVDKGIKIAKELFGDPSLQEYVGKTRKIGVFEKVAIVDQMGDKTEVNALIDTGAYRSSIDEGLAIELGLLREDNILFDKGYRSALGRHKRKIISFDFYLSGRKVSTAASVTDRSHMKRPMLVGRRDLKGYVIDFSKKDMQL